MKVPTRITPNVDVSARPLAPLQIDGATPDAFGAPIGEGLKAFGQGGLRMAVSLAKEAEEEKTKDFTAQREMVRRNGEFTVETDEIKRGAAPNGLGTRKALLDAFDKKFGDDFLKFVPADKREEYSVKIQTLRSRVDVEGYGFERDAAAAHAGVEIEDSVNQAKGRIEKTPDSFNEIRNEVFDTIRKAPLSNATKAELERKANVTFQEMHLLAVQRNNRKLDLTADLKGPTDVFLRMVGQAESGGDPTAKNKNSSAGGIAQFIDRTWIDLIKRHRSDIWNGLPGTTAEEKSAAAVLMKEDSKLSMELAQAYAMENARDLRNSGFTVTPGNLYLAHFLGPNGAKAVLGARSTADIRTVVGNDAYQANLAVFEKARTPEELIEWARGKMSGDSSPARALPKLAAVKGADGYWRTPNIEYNLDGKIRAEPVTKEYAELVSSVLKSIDPGLGAVITSAGQEPGEGTGSHRHNVDHTGHAGTSDFVLKLNGKTARPADAPELYEKVIEQLAGQGFTGIGHYSWGLHVGGGSRAFWGPDKTRGTADPKFLAAAERGWAKAGDYKRDAFDTDSRYAAIPYERRVAIRADAEKLANADTIQIFQEEQARNAAWKNDFFIGLNDGKLGQAALDAAKAEGRLSSYEDQVKAQKILDNKKEEQTLEQSALLKYKDPMSVWDAGSKDDRDKANALVGGERGRAALVQDGQRYMAQFVLPFIQRARVIPTDVSGQLAAMLQLRDPEKAWFALDALSQIQRANPEAYDIQVTKQVQESVDRWNALKDYTPRDELLRAVRGGDSPEDRNIRIDRRKEGVTFLAEKKNKTPQIDTIVADILKDSSSVFQRVSPDTQLPFAMAELERQVHEIWLTEYERGATEEQATKIATDSVKRRWGIWQMEGQNQFMELPPPKAGYKSMFGGFSWMGAQLRTELKLTPTQSAELQADAQTKDEFARWQANPKAPLPSYRLYQNENGVKIPLYDNKGMPKRFRFEPTVDDLAKDADYMQARSTQLADEAFFRDFDQQRLHSEITRQPIPRDIVEEYELRKGRQEELDKVIRRTDPINDLKPIMEYGPGGL